MHAGEAAGPESVWEALELLGADRIGHGIRSFEDPQLVEHLRKHRICLEMCPTSNLLTGCVPSLEEHPLPRALEAGVPASINTDDSGICGVTLPSEIALSIARMGLGSEQVEMAMRFAEEASFLHDSVGPISGS